jgi:hypothetical protein
VQAVGPRRVTMLTHEQQMLQKDEQADLQCQLAVRSLDELRPHPSYARHQLSVSASHLSSLAALGRLAFREPIVITRKGIVVDGYARWELARRQGHQTILCLEYDLTEEEALRWLIQSHHPSRALNGFCRTLLALDLEPFLREQARANQRVGGQNKNASTLTEAKRLDVRSEIAAAAGVSTGNVTKVRQIMKTTTLKLREALQAGQVRIHRAWQWRQLSPKGQLRELEFYLSQKGSNRVIRQLIRRHVAKRTPLPPNQPNLGDLLKCRPLYETGELASISVVVIDVQENIAFLSKGALRILGSLEE